MEGICLHQCVQTGSGVHPAFCPMDTGVLPQGKEGSAWSWPFTSF